MRIGWLIIGVLIAVGIFLFYPKAWDTLVSFIQTAFKYASDWMASKNATNLTGGL